MLAKLKNYVELGVHPENSEEENNLLKILNIFSLMCIVLALPYVFLCLWSGQFVSLPLFVGAQLILSLALIANHRRNYTLAKVLIFITTNYSIFSLALLYGPESGFQTYYNTAPLVAFTLYGFKKLKNGIAFGLFYISSYFMIEVIGFNEYTPPVTLEPTVIEFLSTLNIVFTLLFNGIIAYSYSKMHYSANESLLHKIDENKVLMAEVHHRVKNNLAIMSSLFNLQLNKSSNQEVIDILTKNRARLKSISLLHESLYLQDNVSKIMMKDYIERLVEDIGSSISGEEKSVEINFDIGDIEIELKRAVPCGILLNEIIVNAFKYAFKGKDKGTVYISFQKEKDIYQLVVSDNGIGFNKEVDQKPESLGMELIDALVEQLDATCVLENENGAKYTICFPE